MENFGKNKITLPQLLFAVEEDAENVIFLSILQAVLLIL